MDQNLLEIFLNYCTKGISIDFKNSSVDLPTKFLNDFSYIAWDNEFIIFDKLQENEFFRINNIGQCKIKEFEDYIKIHNGDNEIIIQEIV